MSVKSSNEHVDRNQYEELSSEEIFIKIWSFFRILFKNWIFISSTTIAGLSLGIFFSNLQDPKFKSELSFFLDNQDKSQGLNGIGNLASQFSIDVSAGNISAFSEDNIIRLFESRLMIESTLLKAVEKTSEGAKCQTLANLYLAFSGLKKKWANSKNNSLRNINFPFNSNPAKFNITQDSVLDEIYEKILKENLTVERPERSSEEIVVTILSTSEEFSKNFNISLVEQVSRFYSVTKTKKLRQNVDLLEHQTDSTKKELYASLYGIALTRDINQNPITNLGQVPETKRQIDVSRLSATYTELSKNLELAKISLFRETPLIQIIDSPKYPLKKTQLGLIKGAVIGLIIGFTLSVIVVILRQVIQK